MTSPDAVVVGAGPNGLAAAVALAGAGWRVRLIEGADRVGGGTRTEELTEPGFRHDVCSAVHPMGVASPFLRTLPLGAHGLEWLHPEHAMAHPFDDGTAAVLRRSLAETGDSLGRDGRAYRRLMAPFVERWQDVIEDALSPPIRIPRNPLLMAGFGMAGLRSALGLARSRFESERARAFFLGIAAHTLLPMDRTPSAAFGLVLALCGHAVGWPIARGGSQSIADALASLLRARGGEIETGRWIRSLDELPPSRATFLDLTPRQVLQVAGERLPPRYAAHLRRFRYAPGVFKMDWALSEPIPWTAAECHDAGTIHIGPTADVIARSADAAWYRRPDDEPYVILAQPTVLDPGRAPPGGHVAWAYCHVPNGARWDMTAAVERQIERFAPGFRDIIMARHAMDTAAMEAHDPNLVGGDISGGVQDMRQLLFRPTFSADPYRTPLHGLFLCSAATPPGGAVHGMCGWNAARSALRSL